MIIRPEKKDAMMNDIEDFIAELPEDSDVIEEQLQRFALALPAHQEWAKVARLCTDFLEGRQLSKAEIDRLTNEGRAHTIINKIRPLVYFLAGHFRANRYESRCLPANDGRGVQEIADILTHQLKQIDECNNGDWVDAQIFLDGIVTSRGFWDVRMDYSRNRLGEVSVMQENPFSILIDPEADSYNPNPRNINTGWNFQTKVRWMSIHTIFQLFGKAVAMDVNAGMDSSMPIDSGNTPNNTSDYIDSPSDTFGNDVLEHFTSSALQGFGSGNHVHYGRKLIKVIDTQHVRLKKVTIFFDKVTGEEFIVPDGVDETAVRRMYELFQLRGYNIGLEQAYRRCIRWTITAGSKILYDKWSPYIDQYTYVPYFPYFRRGFTRGMIEDLIEPQREINRRRSAFLNIVMTASNSGWMYEKGTLSDEEKDNLEQFGATAGVHVEYEKGFQSPQRIQPANSPIAVREAERASDNDVKEIAGINDSALGNLDKVQSGRAIEARQKQAIVGAEMFFDNFAQSRSIKSGVIIAQVQKFYTEERIIRLRGEKDPAKQEIVINQKDAAGNIKNNISLGAYDVIIDEAPASASFIQGQFQEAMELRSMNIPIPDDIIIELSSLPNKERILERMKQDREIALANAAMANYAQHMQLGIPPEQAPPPIAVMGEQVTQPMPPVQPAPMMPQPMQPPMDQQQQPPQFIQSPETLEGGVQ